MIWFLVSTFLLYGLWFVNDISVDRADVGGFERVLVVFPHPDDEVLSSGGLIHQLNWHGKQVTLLILSKGERGTEGAHLDESLKWMRREEARKAASILGVTDLRHMDFPDGEVGKDRQRLKRVIEEVMEEVKPDLTITYDLSGLYGHPDHVVVAEVVSELVLADNPEMDLWYATLNKRIMGMVNLPEEMATDAAFIDKRMAPTVRVQLGPLDVLARIRALYAYKSQREAFRKAYPVQWLPMWLYQLFFWNEYFYEVNSTNL